MNPIQTVVRSARSSVFAAFPVSLAILVGTPSSHAGPILLPWILTQPGCAEWQKAGECPSVDYIPSGDASGLSDSDYAQIVESCAPSVIGLDKWATTTAPSIGKKCENLILSKVSLSDELAHPADSYQSATRSALARAIHALLFVPLVDSGGFFGSADSKDYCPSLYRDYLGADLADSIGDAPIVMSREAYRQQTIPNGLHLVRFILERTHEFTYKYEAPDGDNLYTIASEQPNETIKLRQTFGKESNALVLAGILVHESRHNAVGFEDGSFHVRCESGGGEGSFACDETMFGSYGAGIAYLDAALRGGMRSISKNGTPLLSWDMMLGAYKEACSLYMNRIEERSSSLTNFFQATGCKITSAEDLQDALASAYGVDPSDVLGVER